MIIFKLLQRQSKIKKYVTLESHWDVAFFFFFKLMHIQIIS